jgi:hypothetical protein
MASSGIHTYTHVYATKDRIILFLNTFEINSRHACKYLLKHGPLKSTGHWQDYYRVQFVRKSPIIPRNPLFIRHKKKTACSFVTNYITWRPCNTRQFVAMVTRNSVILKLSLTVCVRVCTNTHTQIYIDFQPRSFMQFSPFCLVDASTCNWNLTDVNIKLIPFSAGQTGLDATNCYTLSTSPTNFPTGVHPGTVLQYTNSSFSVEQWTRSACLSVSPALVTTHALQIQSYSSSRAVCVHTKRHKPTPASPARHPD